MVTNRKQKVLPDEVKVVCLDRVTGKIGKDRLLLPLSDAPACRERSGLAYHDTAKSTTHRYL